jgi:hypothetical protein
MSPEWYDRALRRVRLLSLVVAVTGSAAFWFAWGVRPAVGFLIGAALSLMNFRGLLMMVNVLGGSAKPEAVAAVLVALRYLLIGCAIYVIVRFLGVTPSAVVWGLLAVFAAVILEILYEFVFRIHE